ncbi:MAG TPA: hypothetical protein VFN67_33540 [Polyangiales bacterium]|nr:hypothetical protein [Polyangiales bacterium]
MGIVELLYDAVCHGVDPAVADEHVSDARLAFERPDSDPITGSNRGPHTAAADLEACVFTALHGSRKEHEVGLGAR